MMSSLLAASEVAYAKINLALHVRTRREDGYHMLDTLFAFAEDGDIVEAHLADTLSLTIDGPFGEGLDAGPDNLVLRAADGLRGIFGVKAGAALHLDKRLPVAAGIGGGSADAAATIRLLTRLWDVPIQDRRVWDLAAALGADVPACLESQPVRGVGRGDELTPIPAKALSGLPLLLINPRVPLSTGPVFRAWDGVDRGALGEGDPLIVSLAGRNDLEKPARQIVPVIAEVVEALAAQAGVRLARMSGSGATCFAIFDSDDLRDAAHRRFLEAYPEWWCLNTRLR